MLAEDPTRQLLYVADPMCSWCWGFSPVIARVVEVVADRAGVWLVMGGLSVESGRRPLDPATKAEIRHHWEQVHRVSGQPFDLSFFEREGLVYDTEPACRAVVAMRSLRPGRPDPRGALAFLQRLHRAFYAEGRDLTETGTLVELAVEHGVSRDAFEARLSDEDTAMATRQDFALSRELGVRGFPTLLAFRSGRPRVITIGYRPAERVLAAIDAWLAETP